MNCLFKTGSVLLLSLTMSGGAETNFNSAEALPKPLLLRTTERRSDSDTALATNTPSVVRIVKTGAGYQLQRNGQPYFVKGAVVGPGGSLDLLRASGANSIRTQAGLLDEAQRRGFTALVGLPLGNPRRGFDYADTNKVEAQFNRARDLVRKYRVFVYAHDGHGNATTANTPILAE